MMEIFISIFPFLFIGGIGYLIYYFVKKYKNKDNDRFL